MSSSKKILSSMRKLLQKPQYQDRSQKLEPAYLNHLQQLLPNPNDQLFIYQPFSCPPNLLKADLHKQATSIGIPLNDDSFDDVNVCPCCQNPIKKKSISICCNEDQLVFLGVGYPLYFKLVKYIASIVLLVFFISGGMFYFLSTFHCGQNCFQFLGFKVIDLNQENSPSKKIQIFNLVTAIGIFCLAIYVKSLIHNDITQLQSKVICPSQYTIMLQNLPKTFQQYELQNWISQTFCIQSISINLSYNIQQLQTAYRHRNELTIQLKKYLIKNRKFKTENDIIKNGDDLMENKERQYNTKINQCDIIIQDYSNQKIQCQKNGTAFVTFQNMQTVENIIDTYQLNFLTRMFATAISKLRKNHKLNFKGKTVIVSRAPAPRQVIWDNLEYSFIKNFTFQLFFIASMCTLIYLAFEQQYKFASYAYKLRQQGKQSGKGLIIFQAIVMSLIVLLLNSLLRVIILLFTKWKKHYSYTSQQSSFCFYYTIMYVLNSCFMIYVIHGQYPQQTNELLLYDIHFVMLANAFSEPLFKLLDPVMWARIIWKRYVSTLKDQNNPYTQMYVNKLWEGHEISNGDNYQYAARILFITVWFAHAAPLGVIFSLVGLFFDYWIGKTLLLRTYKKPENISKSIATPILNCFELLPLIYICGVLEFVYKVSNSDNIFEFATKFLQQSITISVLIICVFGYLLCMPRKKSFISSYSYTQIRKYISFNYQTQNPITKFKGQINYLYGILKAQHNNQDKEFINKVIKQQKGRKSGIGNLRFKMGNQIDLDRSDQMIEMNNFNINHQAKDQFRLSNSSSSSGANQTNKKKINMKFRLKTSPSLLI